jgi:hypothetical protein
MNWTLVIVLSLIVVFLVRETVGEKLQEGFSVARRSDIGYMADGWKEETGYIRDLRYSETFTDIQGLGVAADFCRAVARKNDPESLHMACALATRDGMDTLEYRSKSTRDGFRWSRDDYWNIRTGRRSDYCRILKDHGTGEWFASCAVAGRDGFKPQEERDTAPPAAIRQMLEAYEGILTWYRLRDDIEDYAQNTVLEFHGRPEPSTLLNPIKSRGLQFNRWSAAAQAAGHPAPPLTDYVRWGEPATLELNQSVPPRQIRAIAFWIWWDGFERGTRILEASNGKNKDLLWIGTEGGGVDLPPARGMIPAAELPPNHVYCIGQMTEPAAQRPPASPPRSDAARYVMEIWDEQQRIMRIESPTAAAKAGQWQHVAFTVTDATEWWPTWQLWIDGRLVQTRTDGRLSPALELTQNFLGQNVRGCLQDFRVYRTPLTEAKLKAAIAWSKPLLHPQP